MLAFLLILIDLALKSWASFQEPETWSGMFYVYHNQKPLTLYSLFSVSIFVWISLKHRPGFWVYLLWGGILSNTIERIIYGSVTDMIPVNLGFQYIILNLADVYLVVAGIVLTCKYLRHVLP